MAIVVKLGSLLLDGEYTKPGAEYYPHQIISFGGENSLSWVVVDGRLIADRPLLVNISWDDLELQHLVFGKPMTVNGQKFLCRLLKVGTKDGDPNEWDSTLDVLGEENHLWHWENCFFWGQENTGRGCFLARGWIHTFPEDRDARLGFRPTLVPISSDNLFTGMSVCAIGGQSILYGELLEATAYDAVIKPETTTFLAESDKRKFYTQFSDGSIIIDRNQMAIQTIREE